MSGKGDKRRKGADDKAYRDNYDAIFNNDSSYSVNREKSAEAPKKDTEAHSTPCQKPSKPYL